MKSFVITKQQFLKLQEIFEKYDPENLMLIYDHSSGIGPTITAEFESRSRIKVDITDIESW